MKNKHWECAGPIVLSALSLFLSFLFVQPIALALDLQFNLLASRGIGKVAFVWMVIYQILLLLTVYQGKDSDFLKKFFQRNLLFFVKERWFLVFASYFATFFSFHSLILLFFYHLGYLVYQPGWGVINFALIAKTLFGLFVVFMLAWTEELIFRGTIYPYLAQYYTPLSSMLVTSFIFMIVHNLSNPIALITTDWQLGLGLFLLGLLLNQVFFITGKLYAGMGIHAGLVFVKVVLRRAPFVVFLQDLPWWMHKDLRQSHLVHLLFIITIVLIFRKSKTLAFQGPNQSL